MRYSFEILFGAVIFEILMRRTLSCLASVGLVSGKVYFSETFGEGWEGRWTVSDWKKSEGTQGSWFASAGKWFADEKEDVGLQITEDSKFFGNEAEAATFAETEGWEVKDVGVHREEACFMDICQPSPM